MHAAYVPSYQDLGGLDCEGWLWLKVTDYFARWCVLKNSVLRLYVHSESQEAEVLIPILNNKVRLVKKSKSSNQYFKIGCDEAYFMFGTESHSDYWRWVKRLRRNSADIITEKNNGGFQCFCSNNEIHNTHSNTHRTELDSFNLDDCVVDNCPDTSSNEHPRPITPPRKNLLKKDTITNSSRDNINSNRVKVLSKSELSKSPNILKGSTMDSESNVSKISKFDDGDDTSKNRAINNSGSLTHDTEVFVNQTSEHISSNQNCTNNLMDLTKEIIVLERRLKVKELFVKEIDRFLKSAHLSDTVAEFWDEHYEQILR